MIDGRIKFRHLQCFIIVAQQRSLVKAAALLSITQPAVSKTLKELEDILQARLFERGRKGAQLTRQGETFFEYAEASVNALQQGTYSIAQSRASASEVIRIGTAPSLTGSFVPEALLEFRRRAGNLQVTLFTDTTAGLLAKLREREFDLVLSRHTDPEQMVGLSFEYLFVDPLVAVVRPGHPLLDAGQADPAALGAFTSVLPIKGSVNRHAADTFAAEHGIDLGQDFVEDLSMYFGRSYTIASDAVWYVPWSAVRDDVAAGALVRLALPVKSAGDSTGLLGRVTGLMTRASSTPSPAAQVLIGAIRDVALRRRAEAF
ncbi:transcriptional regulator, LysR family [Noviherbaspirillum humi]|uniref:Transcriptional regulator, LysR family n=1 Tax=Noviherbaspirillum humi TaxID=1688639 RepID=A0A239F821_9BURK|nr:LysR substrate-binding domain-containing protein [Noviherbaspirillum humi]SNS52947.1 transcriptional regulator, LysR family [Noviherbaspirillum humi]